MHGGRGMISLIWAQGLNGEIGLDNRLPWSIPNDLKYFKKITTGHTVVMGRKTFESMGCQLLPNRKNVIITTQEDYKAEGATVINYIDEIKSLEGEVFIIGGAKLFETTVDIADRIYRTLIYGSFDADTFIGSDLEYERFANFLLRPMYTVCGIGEKNSHAQAYQVFDREVCNDEKTTDLG